MMDWSECPAVESVPGKLSGAWVFKNTRLPISALFGNLTDGATIHDFIDWFGGVAQELDAMTAEVSVANPA